MRSDQNKSRQTIVIPFSKSRSPSFDSGYTLLILMFVVFLLGIVLLAVTPLWQTQVQRELEEELIFRGKQYVEAIRLYQIKKPGQFPDSMEELKKEKCIRRLYLDPMTKNGSWNIILRPKKTARSEQGSPQTIIVAPVEAITGIAEPHILGVVSSSKKKSVKIYNNQETYDNWFFFLGQDPDRMPKIIIYGQEEEE